MRELEKPLESDAAPDVGGLPGLNKFYLDLTPYVNVSYWEKITAPLCLGTENLRVIMESMAGKLS